MAIVRGSGKAPSPMLSSVKSRTAIVDAQTKMHAAPRMAISSGILAAASQWALVGGGFSIQGVRRSRGRKSTKEYSNKPTMFFLERPQSNTQPIAVTQTTEILRTLCVGKMRQLAKTITPQMMRVEGDNLRMRACPEPQKSRNDVTIYPCLRAVTM